MPKTSPTASGGDFIFPLRNREGQLYAWKVDIQRARKLHIKVFTFIEHGGKKSARKAAESLRNKILKIQNSPSRCRTHLATSHTSNHPGVYRVQSNNITYWRAATRVHGHNLSKSFRIDLHGEEQAKLLAIREREHQLILCDAPYEVAMEKLQHPSTSNQTSSKARESRIEAAMKKPHPSRPIAAQPWEDPGCEPLPAISPEQAYLSIIRHFAASEK